MNKYHKIPLISVSLFLLANIISVAYAWITNVHRFDLGISFSAYIGLQRWTSVIYFVFAAIIVTSMAVYVSKLKVPAVKKVIHGIILLCIFGTAFFPFNAFSKGPTALTIDLHNYFGIALMLVTTVSFILTAILTKVGKHRLTALLSLVYAAGFITLYFIGVPLLYKSFFVWENIFIILLFVELYMEKYEEK